MAGEDVVRIFFSVLFIVLGSLLSADNFVNEEQLYDFHSSFAGVWDELGNLEAPGYTMSMSWGRTNFSITSLLVIDLLDQEGQIDLDFLTIANESYRIKEYIKLDNKKALVRLEERSSYDPGRDLESGYYTFNLSENGQKLLIRPLSDSLDYVNSMIGSNYSMEDAEKRISRVEYYCDQELHKRSGPSAEQPLMNMPQ